MPLTQERLKEILDYNEYTGVFTWIDCADRKHNGKEAGVLRSDGYRLIRINYIKYLVGRLAWFYMTGEWPAVLVDHKDRNPSNNRWDNLRLATYAQNNANSERIDKGIRPTRNGRRWEVYIWISGRQIQLGTFDTKEEAREVFATAHREHHGEFANP